MRVGLISDTHNPSVGDEPPSEVLAAFKGVDVIIHAGDIYQPECLDWLEKIAPVYAVELGASAHFSDDDRVEDMHRVIELGGHSIGRPPSSTVAGLRGALGLAGELHGAHRAYRAASRGAVA